MKRRFASLLLGLLALACSAAGAGAQEIKVPEGRRTVIGAGRFWGSLQVELLSVRDPAHKLFFDKSHAEQYTLEVGMRLTENLDLLGSLGYRHESAFQFQEGSTTARLTNEDILHTFPMAAALRYRIQWEPDAWFIPYVRGGVTGAWFVYDEDTIGVGKLWGVKWGANAGAGILWRIDGLDPNSARSLRNQGIDGMYLDTGFHWQRVNDFGGTGFDYSGMGARLGLTIWVR